jgi:deazaflavin-dependent oxidoreductase (nitroreductase family)
MEPNVLTRLKMVAGKKTTTLTHCGGKTEKPHEVTIWFVLDDDKLYIGTANVNRQWVRNVQKTPKIRLSIGGETLDGNARVLTDRAEHERAMAAIRRKYWMFRTPPSIAHRRQNTMSPTLEQCGCATCTWWRTRDRFTLLRFLSEYAGGRGFPTFLQIADFLL